MRAHLNKTEQTQGFTLVETLVSVLLLSIALTAIVTLLTRALQATAESQQYLVASKLAQEGLEMVRVRRNNNIIANMPWNDGLVGVWEVDITTANTSLAPGNSFGTVASGALRTFCVRTSGSYAGSYTYVCGASAPHLPGNFTRMVRVTGFGTYSAEVTADVVWNSGSNNFSLSGIIFEAT